MKYLFINIYGNIFLDISDGLTTSLFSKMSLQNEK